MKKRKLDDALLETLLLNPKPKTFKVKNSNCMIRTYKVLERLNDFLPKIQASNNQLAQQIKEEQDVNLEVLNDEQEFIEMVLCN
jgi:hypothetical protein